jgi:hypothetical protein
MKYYQMLSLTKDNNNLIITFYDAGLGSQADVVRGEVFESPGNVEGEPGLEQVDADPELARSIGSSGGNTAKRIG